MNVNYQNKAIELFNNGYNCAQSVLLPFSESLDIDKKLATNITAGFGAGMGGSQKTCGAVTGAYMVLGLHTGIGQDDITEKKEKTTKLIKAFNAEFLKIHKTTDCLTLLNCDFSTEDGKLKFTERGLRKKICEVCIKDAISIVRKFL